MMAFFGRCFINTQLGYRAGIIGCSRPANPAIEDRPNALWIHLQYLCDPIDRHFPLNQG
jgi:hypothetical protein